MYDADNSPVRTVTLSGSSGQSVHGRITYIMHRVVVCAAIFSFVAGSDAFGQVRATAAGNAGGQSVVEVLRGISKGVDEIKSDLRKTDRRLQSTAQRSLALTRGVANVGANVDSLSGQMRGLEGKLETLEGSLRQIRTDIAALQALAVQSQVSALANSRALDTQRDRPEEPVEIVTPRIPSDPLRRAEHFVRRGNIADGRDALVGLIADLQDSDDSEEATETRFVLAEVLYAEKSYKAAAGALLVALTHGDSSPRKPQGLLTFARVLKALGQPQQACATLDELLLNSADLDDSLKEAANNEKRTTLC